MFHSIAFLKKLLRREDWNMKFKYSCIFFITFKVVNKMQKIHKNTYTFIVVSMQCLLYLFYHQLSLQKHRICVKGHQNILRHQEFYRAGTTPPGFEITVSATGGSRRRGGGVWKTQHLISVFQSKLQLVLSS